MMRKSGHHFFENIMLKLKKKPHHVIAEAIPLRRMMLEHDVIRWTHLRRSDFGAWAGVRRKAYRQYGRGVQGRRFPGGRVKGSGGEKGKGDDESQKGSRPTPDCPIAARHRADARPRYRRPGELSPFRHSGSPSPRRMRPDGRVRWCGRFHAGK